MRTKRMLPASAVLLTLSGALMLGIARPSGAAGRVYCDPNAIAACWCLTGVGGATGLCVNTNSTQTLIYCDGYGPYPCQANSGPYSCPGGAPQLATGTCSSYTIVPGTCTSGLYYSC